MKNYYGYFDILQEMGSGTSFYFREEKSKYLSGYEQLELAYFFKIYDKFTLIVTNDNKIEYHGPLTFVYNKKLGTLVPKEISLKKLNTWISQKKMVVFQSNFDLFKEYFILKSESLEESSLKAEIKRLMESKNIPEKFKKYQSDFQELEKYFNILNKDEAFLDFLVKKQDFLFGESPLDIILTNRSEHLISWFKDRI